MGITTNGKARSIKAWKDKRWTWVTQVALCVVTRTQTAFYPNFIFLLKIVYSKQFWTVNNFLLSAISQVSGGVTHNVGFDPAPPRFLPQSDDAFSLIPKANSHSLPATI